jgi:hypothetical protein
MPLSTRLSSFSSTQEEGKRREREQRVLLTDRTAYPPQHRQGRSSAVYFCDALCEIQRTAQLGSALRAHEEGDIGDTRDVRGCWAVLLERCSETAACHAGSCVEAGRVEEEGGGLSKDLRGAVPGSGHEKSAAPSSLAVDGPRP